MHVYKPPPVGGLDRVPVYTAGTGSTRADLFELDGVTPMPDNVLVADTHGNLPSFQCATAPVYVGVSGSRTTWAPSESGEPSAASGWVVVTTTAAHVVATDHERIFCSAAATTDVTAPAPGGKVFTVTNTGATGSVTVLPHAAETVNGAALFTVGPGASLTLSDDNTNWWGV